MKKLFFLLAAMFLFSAIITSCAGNTGEAPKTAATAAAPPSAVKDEDKQWTMANKDYGSTRYSSLNSINTDTVKNLRAAWTFSTGVLRGLDLKQFASCLQPHSNHRIVPPRSARAVSARR